MDTHLKNLISAYNAKLFTRWLVITSILFGSITCVILGISIKFALSYTALKKEHHMLLHEVSLVKDSLCMSKKLVKKRKLLKEQLDLCAKNNHSQVLIAISKAIPANTYLTTIAFEKTLIIEGYAPSLHDLTLFVTQLKACGLSQVTIEKADAQDDAFFFQLNI